MPWHCKEYSGQMRQGNLVLVPSLGKPNFQSCPLAFGVGSTVSDTIMSL